jgi:hypothetical protein
MRINLYVYKSMRFLGTFMQVCLPKVWVRVCAPKAPRRAQFEKKMTQIFRALVNKFFSCVQRLGNQQTRASLLLLMRLEPHFYYLEARASSLIRGSPSLLIIIT